MKRPRIQRDEIASLLFGLAESNVKFRNQWRWIIALVLWITLSLATMLFAGDQILTPYQRLAIVAMSFIKYLPLFYVIYNTSKSKAARYLDDIFELQNQTLAENFIEEVAFGEGQGKITINEGKISEKDEHSPIILIGGPGKIKVNLGSAALLEQVDGDPEVIYARSQPWKLERFERIREIGEDDHAGKREYAAINLRDQFVGGLSVKSRTKDGISIEAQDIKVIFSILRKPQSHLEKSDEDPYSFDERAVQALVYNQTLITPPPQNTGVGFPWDTTVIPLVTNELEKLITTSALSQILSSISQKELDLVSDNEATNAQIRVEITGEFTRTKQINSMNLRRFETRSKITDLFFDKAFQEKAAKLGIVIHWIDIGTWQLPHGTISNHLKQAWEQARENIKRRNQIEGSRKKLELEKLLEIIHTAILDNFHKSPISSKSYDKDYGDYEEFIRLFEKASEVNKTEPSRPRPQEFKTPSAKEAFGTAREILRAFRKEFLSVKELIQKENKPYLEKEVELATIEKVLREIETLLHPPKNNPK